MSQFCLVNEPWVPVVEGGRRRAVSLLDALVRAHEIGELATDRPLETVAVLRQALLPVVLDALGAPADDDEWERRWRGGQFDAARLIEYLNERADRFDLFHPVRPFAQSAGLRTAKDETKPASLMLPAIATGNNVPLFSSRTEAEPPALSPAEAARAVLAVHCWDTAAIKSGAADDPVAAKGGKTSGNPTGPVGRLGVVIPFGANLFETLMLNTPVMGDGFDPVDRPQWMADQPATGRWRERRSNGLLDLLTWQSRRIRLVPEIDHIGAAVVRSVVLTAGDRITQRAKEDELHTAWRMNKKPRAGQPSVTPIRHQPGRAIWQGMASLLATSPDSADETSRLLGQLARLRAVGVVPNTLSLQVLAVGVSYGNMQAVVENMIADLMPLPVAALHVDDPVRSFILEVVENAGTLQKAANVLGDDLRQACGGDRVPWDKSQRLGDVFMHECTRVVRRLLGGLRQEPDRVDDARSAWRKAAREIAYEVAAPALTAAPPTAFLGRQDGQYAHRLSVAEAKYRAKINQLLGQPAVA